jgi:uncharacterized protein (TIGR03437 family)
MKIIVLVIVLILGLSFTALAQHVDAILFAAGQPPGPTILTQGSLISIYGHNLATTTAAATTYPWPRELGGTAVWISDGKCICTALQLIYVSPNQINAEIPPHTGSSEEAQPSPYPWINDQPFPWGTHTLSVQVNGVFGLAKQFTIGTMSPALFTLDGKHAAAQHANYQVVSSPNPAAPEEYIALYATGLDYFGGPTPTPGVAEFQFLLQSNHGDISPWATGTVDGLPAKITYIGPVPAYGDGLDQVNFQIPAGVRRGTAVPVIMTLPGVSHDPTSGSPVSNAVLLAIN